MSPKIILWQGYLFADAPICFCQTPKQPNSSHKAQTSQRFQTLQHFYHAARSILRVISPACWGRLSIFIEICIPCGITQLFLVLTSEIHSLEELAKRRNKQPKTYSLSMRFIGEEARLVNILFKRHCVLEAFPDLCHSSLCSRLDWVSLLIFL